MRKKSQKKGFTLIEAIVSIGLFMVVMTVSASALLSIINANKQAHQIKTVMDNINFALDSMVRDIRIGSDYDCVDSLTPPNYSGAPNSTFSYVSGEGINAGKIVTDYLSGALPNGDHQVLQCIGGTTCAQPLSLTDPQMDITGLHFFVSGVGSATNEPRVVIVITGSAGTGVAKTSFNLETSVTEL